MATISLGFFSDLKLKSSSCCYAENILSPSVLKQKLIAPNRRIRVSSSMKKMYKGTQMREQRLTELIEQKVSEAQQLCGGGENSSEECKVAWDEVEEVSQAKADLRLKIHQLHQDPLQSFCSQNPHTDECRIVEEY